MRLWHGPDDWTDGRNAGRAGRIRWYADSVLRVADKYGTVRRIRRPTYSGTAC